MNYVYFRGHSLAWNKLASGKSFIDDTEAEILCIVSFAVYCF